MSLRHPFGSQQSLQTLWIFEECVQQLSNKDYFKTLNRFTQCSSCRHKTFPAIPYFYFHTEMQLNRCGHQTCGTKKPKGILGNTRSGNTGCLIQSTVQEMAWNKDKSAAGIEIHSQTLLWVGRADSSKQAQNQIVKRVLNLKSYTEQLTVGQSLG